MLGYGAGVGQPGLGRWIEIWRCGIYVARGGSQLDNVYDELLRARQPFAVIYLKIHSI